MSCGLVSLREKLQSEPAETPLLLCNLSRKGTTPFHSAESRFKPTYFPLKCAVSTEDSKKQEKEG